MGNSDLLDRALSTAIRVANTDLTVLIQGESGVGKEVFSKIIHNLSGRKHNEFIAINCGAIPAGTINSELFGHEKGAFTGAMNDRKGYFETVNGGSIFLDEIGEMPLDTQSFLLRVLESGEFFRVGSSKVQKTNIRVIAATNVDLKEKIKAGKFREDLYYRLNTVPIWVPALKERPEDVMLLVKKFARDFSEKYGAPTIELNDQAQILMRTYSWPGNIRELKNVVEQLSVLSEDKVVTAEELIAVLPDIRKRNLPSVIKNDHFEESGFAEREIMYKFLVDMKKDLTDLKSLVFEMIKANNLHVPEVVKNNPILIKSYNTEELPYSPEPVHEVIDYKNVNDFTEDKPIILDKKDQERYHAEVVEFNLNLEDMEKDLITKALDKHRGKRKQTADELGISERTLYRKIKQYNIPN
ncbi:MAG TPA: sigma-54 dependent transcriptional regulator [Saprospiraceae bacterium]|nr:sigma-54 dependent transcriptional regulator [Saprospiraceae bacterium]